MPEIKQSAASRAGTQEAPVEEAAIRLTSQAKGLAVIVDSGETLYLPTGAKVHTKKPLVIEFTRHQAVVRPDVWKARGWTREQMLEAIHRKIRAHGGFVVDAPPTS